MQVTRYGPNFVAEGATKSQPMPKGVKATLKAYEAQNTNPELAGVDVARISGAKGRDLLLRSEARPFDVADASHAKAAVTNATLWVVGFSYGTGKPMEGFLSDLPKDKKVKFNVICTPSAHAGSTTAEMQQSFELFANTNVYVASIFHEAADGTRTTLAQQTYKVQNPPEYASLSPEMEVDLSGLNGGKLIIEGYPEGSGGVFGYVEARQTVIAL